MFQAIALSLFLTEPYILIKIRLDARNHVSLQSANVCCAKTKQSYFVFFLVTNSVPVTTAPSASPTLSPSKVPTVTPTLYVFDWFLFENILNVPGLSGRQLQAQLNLQPSRFTTEHVYFLVFRFFRTPTNSPTETPTMYGH